MRQELGVQDLQATSTCVLCKSQSASSRPTKSGRCEIKVLHCLHSVCGGCLEEYLHYGREILCPICDAITLERNYDKYVCNFAEHQGIDHLACEQQKRIACEECVESADAVYYCEQCVRSLCNECSEHHKRAKSTTMHSLVTLREQQASKMHRAASCRVHRNLPYEFFCLDLRVSCAAASASWPTTRATATSCPRRASWTRSARPSA
ncbi:unnamed protein product [Prorocentrum cordatum]|uniref:B box-type domain-containing protein n=1 Tax=Prorocentrum cordatum TaxID=2364126 RepID=A0ABN9XNH2_9DINO|nr:unnamed protein product [Polarella glacialis]